MKAIFKVLIIAMLLISCGENEVIKEIENNPVNTKIFEQRELSITGVRNYADQIIITNDYKNKDVKCVVGRDFVTSANYVGEAVILSTKHVGETYVYAYYNNIKDSCKVSVLSAYPDVIREPVIGNYTVDDVKRIETSELIKDVTYPNLPRQQFLTYKYTSENGNVFTTVYTFYDNKISFVSVTSSKIYNGSLTLLFALHERYKYVEGELYYLSEDDTYKIEYKTITSDFINHKYIVNYSILTK